MEIWPAQRTTESGCENRYKTPSTFGKPPRGFMNKGQRELVELSRLSGTLRYAGSHKGCFFCI